MKIILSRKGFDTSNGDIPSPIMPDGTLLSMPIPSDDELTFKDLCYDGMCYAEILKQLNPKGQYNGCHLDPDIRSEIRLEKIENWKPAFGQLSAAQGVLRNEGVKEGDLFLFFGRFRQTEFYDNKKIRFVKKSPIIQIIYGYMQIGKILTNINTEEITEYNWHPHVANSQLKNSRTNTLYLPSEKFSFEPSLSGSGILSYNDDRVLTMKDKSASVWKENTVYMPNRVSGNRKNSSKSGGIYYAGIWQELVLDNYNEEALAWAKRIIIS